MTETAPTASAADSYATGGQAWSDLPLDQAVALRSAATRLTEPGAPAMAGITTGRL